MPIPSALVGDTWAKEIALAVLPLVVQRAQHGQLVTYGELNVEAMKHGWHHVMPLQYGWPAGMIGSALIELEERWGIRIPPVNAIIVNAHTGLPGKGVNDYLKHYFLSKSSGKQFNLKQRKAIVEEIHADVFAFRQWNRVLRECQLKPLAGGAAPKKPPKKHPKLPERGGWSPEPESEEHRRLKEYVAKHPQVVGLPKSTADGKTEFRFYSADTADVLFKTAKQLLAVEVKSSKSNDKDLNRGIFQAVKYQALLRAEQKARLEPPTAIALLVTERALPVQLAERAELLGITVVMFKWPGGNK